MNAPAHATEHVTEGLTPTVAFELDGQSVT